MGRINRNKAIAKKPETFILLGTKKNLHDHYIQKAAKKHGVDPTELKILFEKESGLNSRIIGHAGEYGIAQYMSKYYGAVNISPDAKKRNEKIKLLSGLKKERISVVKTLRGQKKATEKNTNALNDKLTTIEKKIESAKSEIRKIEKSIHAKMKKSWLSDANKSILRAAKRFADTQKKYPGPHSKEKAFIAHKMGELLGSKKIKNRDTLSKWAKKPEVSVDEIVNKYETIGWKRDARALKLIRLPFRRKHIKNESYNPLTFEGYIVLGDNRKRIGKFGSLENPYVVAKFKDKTKGEKGKEVYVIISKFNNKLHRSFGKIHSDLDSVKRDLFGKMWKDKEVIKGEGKNLSQAKKNFKDSNKAYREGLKTLKEKPGKKAMEIPHRGIMSQEEDKKRVTREGLRNIERGKLRGIARPVTPSDAGVIRPAGVKPPLEALGRFRNAKSVKQVEQKVKDRQKPWEEKRVLPRIRDSKLQTKEPKRTRDKPARAIIESPYSTEHIHVQGKDVAEKASKVGLSEKDVGKTALKSNKLESLSLSKIGAHGKVDSEKKSLIKQTEREMNRVQEKDIKQRHKEKKIKDTK